MHTIYKYPLPLASCEIQMPRGARVLTAQMQYGNPCLWCEVDTEEPLETRAFVAYGTGHRMQGGPHRYVDTLQLDAGALVFHIYELRA